MNVHSALSLLLFLGVIATLDARKIDKILKKVGRRYDQRVRKIIFPINENEFENGRNQTVQFVASLLQGQSSDKNENFKWSATVLSELMEAENFKGGICGENAMNYVQFNDYLTRTRKNYEKNDGEKLGWKMLPHQKHENDFITFLIDFKTYATLGYTSTTTYLVQMKIYIERDLHNEVAYYYIIGIEQVGACTEHGTIHMDETDVGEDRSNQERMDVMQFMSVFEQSPGGEISSDWLVFLAEEDGFTGSVCHGSDQTTFSRKEVINWWNNYKIMYHPPIGVSNYTTVNMIGAAENKKYTFRISMKVQIGNEKSQPIETFDFKLILSQNEGKFGKIDRFEVICKPIPRVEGDEMKKHAKVYKQLIGKRLQKVMKSPELWYKSVDVLKDLVRPKGYEVECCEVTDTDEPMPKLEHDFWEKNKITNGRMEGFVLDAPSSMSAIGETMNMHIGIIWTPVEEGKLHESIWKFDLEWDKNLQFYYVTKIVLGCRNSVEGTERYVNWRD